MTLPDDMTRPSIIRVISQTTFWTVSSPHVQMNRGLMGTKVRYLRASRSFVPSSLRAPSRVVSAGTAERHRKLPFQDAETPDRDQSGVPGECLSGHERLREDRIRRDNLRGAGQCPRVPEEAASHRQPHSGDGQTFRETALLSGTPRSEKLCSLPPGPCKSFSSTPCW